MLAGEPAAYYAPTYKMLTPVWREAIDRLGPIAQTVNVQERRIEFLTGGCIDFWSLDSPNTSRGRKYARAVIDEAAMVPELGEAWNSVIRPTLADLEGDADFYSTPKGRGFFWEAFTHGSDPAMPEWACWQFPTIANPYINPAEIEAAKAQLPERSYQQEFEAVFLDDSGGVFRGVAAAVDKGRTANEPPTEGMSYSLGVDLARVEDFTVLSVMDAAGRQVYFERFNQISWERQVAAITRVANTYKATAVVDSTGLGDPIFEAICKARVPAISYPLTNASKQAAIDNLAMGIENSRVRLMDIPTQTAELQAYQYELTPSRNVRMNAPEGMHDDCVISLALAAWGIGRKQDWNWS